MHQLLRPRFSLAHLALLLITIAGLIVYLYPHPDSPSQAVRHQGNLVLTNPLLECEPNSFQLVQLNPLKNLIIDWLKSKNLQDNTSIYFRDLNNGPWFGINQDTFFSLASLIKVPIMMTYYKLAESDPNILNQQLTFIPTPMIEQPNILPKTTLTPNQTYTIEQLIERMIVYSDNNAFLLLTKHLGQDRIASTFENLDVDLSRIYANPYGNNLSVRQYASFFRILYNSSYLDPEMSEKALKLLTKVDFTQALRRPIPQSYPIAHKFGERSYFETGERQLHDCGIIYLPNRPYLLCVMTRGKSEFSQLENIIASISQTVFEYLSP